MNKKQLTLDALGSGSDYSSFLQHLGITTLDLGFGGENRGGEYHTNFDTYNHYIRFKDPGLAYGAALSKVAGLSALRLANADILPYNFERLYATVEGYVEDLITSTNQLRQTIQIQNKMLEEGIYVVTQNPTEKLAAPPAKAPVPYIDFSPVQNALTSLSAITKQLNTLLNLPTTSPVMTDQLNKTLYHAEQQLLSPEGLPRRGWYRHTLYAPGFYTGYGVKTLPGVREPIEQGQYAEAQQQVTVLADAINRLAAHLSKALQ